MLSRALRFSESDCLSVCQPPQCRIRQQQTTAEATNVSIPNQAPFPRFLPFSPCPAPGFLRLRSIYEERERQEEGEGLPIGEVPGKEVIFAVQMGSGGAAVRARQDMKDSRGVGPYPLGARRFSLSISI